MRCGGAYPDCYRSMSELIPETYAALCRRQYGWRQRRHAPETDYRLHHCTQRARICLQGMKLLCQSAHSHDGTGPLHAMQYCVCVSGELHTRRAQRANAAGWNTVNRWWKSFHAVLHKPAWTTMKECWNGLTICTDCVQALYVIFHVSAHTTMDSRYTVKYSMNSKTR